MPGTCCEYVAIIYIEFIHYNIGSSNGVISSANDTHKTLNAFSFDDIHLNEWALSTGNDNDEKKNEKINELHSISLIYLYH